jgi:uncharacterized protein
MKVIVDTNVFISGIFWKGPPHQILMEWKKGRFKLVVSPSIFEEYQRVLMELSARFGDLQYNSILDLVSFHAEFVTDMKFPQPICTDPDDDKFVAAAISSKTEFIVSGDKALLALNGFEGLKILKPRSFLDQIL